MPDAAARALRVMSYNTRDFLDDRAAAAEVVRVVRPDVLLLQEVPRRPGSTRRVAAWADDAALRWPGGHRGAGGTTVMLSERVTALQVDHRGLTVPVGQRTRGFAMVRGRLEDGPAFTAVSVHLGLHEGQRLRHAHAVLAALPPRGAVVVAGDLNEGADGFAWQAFARHLSALGEDTPTFPARGPRERLDVVWGRGVRALPSDGTRVPAGLAERASDHLPVWVDVRPLA